MLWFYIIIDVSDRDVTVRYGDTSHFFVPIWANVIYQECFRLGVKKNYTTRKWAKNNIERKYYIKPVRGEILDRNGKLLAVNDIGFSIAIAPNLKTVVRS